MKLASVERVNCHHNKYTFWHRVKGVKIGLEIVAFNEQRATEKAWVTVKQIYQDLKKAGKDPFPLPEGATRLDSSETLTHPSVL